MVGRAISGVTAGFGSQRWATEPGLGQRRPCESEARSTPGLRGVIDLPVGPGWFGCGVVSMDDQMQLCLHVHKCAHRV